MKRAKYSTPMNRRQFVTGLAASGAALTVARDSRAVSLPRKAEDIVVYQNEKFYSAFPSIVRRPDGELIVAFRRAPNRIALGEKRNYHADPNSYLVLVRSRDNGKTWSKEPEHLFAHPLGGSQDPCMVQLRDGTILCTSYGWTLMNSDVAAKIERAFRHESTIRHGTFVFLGGYILRSSDGGKSWQGPIIPPPLEGNATRDVFGNPVPVFNRGAMCEGSDGKLYWVVRYENRLEPRLSSTHLMVSADKGETWEYRCPVAEDETASFSETSLYETPSGDLVAFMRTANFDDHTVIARSTNRGQSFEPWVDSGFQGHPHHAIRLPDDRVFLVNGYRHKPYGIRARILDAECTNYKTADEILLRDDGGNRDLGYPWATLTNDGRILAVHYFNQGSHGKLYWQGDGLRHIAGTFLEI